MQNHTVVADFIDQIWNQQNWTRLEEFIHPEYKDHSLSALALENDQKGLKKWIETTSASFEHKTIIEDHVAENDKIVIKIRMLMKHIGVWRDIQPTGQEVSTIGYRFYKLSEGRIIESWALIDGQSLENQLGNSLHGCIVTE